MFDLEGIPVKSKSASATLAANTKARIRIRFSAAARRKVKAAIRDFGPRKVAVTAIATATFGNSSAAKTRFKLVGLSRSTSPHPEG
jgi:hypothetical protein